MINGVLITLACEFVLFIVYIIHRAKREIKEEEKRIYIINEDLYI